MAVPHAAGPGNGACRGMAAGAAGAADRGNPVDFSAGAAGLAAHWAVQALPADGLLWLIARLLMDAAGALFGVYLLTLVVLSLAGRVMRSRRGGRTTVAGR